MSTDGHASDNVWGTLAPSAVAGLDRTGFAVIPGPFPAERCDAVADAYDAAVDSAADADVRVGFTSTRVTDFVNRAPVFDPVYLYPPLLDAAAPVVGRALKLSSFHARTLHLGADVLDLHVDVERDSRDWPLLGFILMIEGLAHATALRVSCPALTRGRHRRERHACRTTSLRWYLPVDPPGHCSCSTGRRGTARVSTHLDSHAGHCRVHSFREMAARGWTSQDGCQPRCASD